MKLSLDIFEHLAQLWLGFSWIIDHFEDCWERSADGAPNQGDDARLLGRIGCFIEWVFSFHPKKFKTNPYAVMLHKEESNVELFVGSPPYAVMNFKWEEKKYLHMRIGWRYDVNWTETGGYIFCAALKFLDRPLIYK